MIQVFVNSIIYASEIAIVAVGISLAYSILRFANFAHIQFAVVGGYATYVATELGLPLILAVPASAVFVGGLAVVVDILVFSRLRHISPEGKMIVSWGVALLIRAIVASIFGGGSIIIETNTTPIRFAGAIFTSLDVIVVSATVAFMVLLHAFLYRTRTGSGLRALASNYDLAVTRGIPGERMIRLMWFISGAYAAIGGSLIALETRLQPNMDLIILLPVFAAVTIGGLSNVFGAVLGALFLSLAQNFIISIDFGSLVSDQSWFVPSQFRDYVAVLALVLVLLLRPSMTKRGAN
ncbi:branched-chain amino acid ABC transporter permease [Bauldia litoralis]|uniref:Branched-chain amino acid transport system permease protein n=1 Tax=Bauldia litoralis TaxID=665467 RepID=A0A1G6BAH4_9HYPH|nr:branched-chain amino acid ABC transporter permease [Bauldia litoralis]SDB17549.1 branched-chain amino acid transport system permease protein [Bauldia litoralis]